MSNETKTQIKTIARTYIPVWVLIAVAVILLVVSFLLPPTGAIDPSVLTASGEIFAFASLITFIVMVERGKKMNFRKGDIEVTAGDIAPQEDMPL